jgi:hypothetical protein
MKTIWKFPVEVVGDYFVVPMPSGSAVLSMQLQNDKPVMWALVDDAAPRVNRRFVVYGTGHPVRSGLGRFIGTFQSLGGRLVFHLFEFNETAEAAK